MEIFGDYHPDRCDLPTMFANVAAVLRWVPSVIYKDAKKVHVLIYVVTYAAMLVYTYVYIISMYWFVFIRCPETGDLVAAFVVFSLGSSSTTCATKFLFINLYSDTVCDLVSQCLEWDAQVALGSRLHSNLLKQLKIIKKRAIGLWVILNCFAVCYIFGPLLRPGRHLPEDLYVIYGLEPTFETPNYEISYFLAGVSVIVIVYDMACVKALFVVILGYVEAQMVVLGIECSYVWDDAKKKFNEGNFYSESPTTTAFSEDRKNRVINEEVKLQLNNILRFHVNSINIIGNFDKFYRVVAVVDFVFTVISMIAEFLGKIENTYLEIPFTFLQIYIDCYLGQKMLDTNYIFENAIYDCKWENFDAKNMKTVYLILLNSQKTRAITSGGVSPMNYVTLMSIIKTIYSAYMTLDSTVS